LLEQLLGQKLSLAEIGRRAGLHESTVGYWIKKHGLEAVGAEKYSPKGGLRREQILVEEAGGRCRLCGYDRHVAALEFHHLDPNAKEFGLAQRGAHRIDKLRAEVRKCVLLCSNCHAEVEAGFVKLT